MRIVNFHVQTKKFLSLPFTPFPVGVTPVFATTSIQITCAMDLREDQESIKMVLYSDKNLSRCKINSNGNMVIEQTIIE